MGGNKTMEPSKWESHSCFATFFFLISFYWWFLFIFSQKEFDSEGEVEDVSRVIPQGTDKVEVLESALKGLPERYK